MKANEPHMNGIPIYILSKMQNHVNISANRIAGIITVTLLRGFYMIWETEGLGILLHRI
jgi:hypothetical protein